MSSSARRRTALGADLIATAHNAGDNAETLLLNLTRGSGLRGLGGIPPRRGRIVRPMLAVTRAEVEEYLSARGIAYMEDSTNALDDYSRNRIRHSVMPVLRGINPRFDLAAPGRAAALMRADEEFLESLARSFVEKNSDSLGLSAAALASAPRSVSSRAVRLLAPRALSEAHVDAVLALSEGTGTAFADVPGARFVREKRPHTRPDGNAGRNHGAGDPDERGNRAAGGGAGAAQLGQRVPR